MKEYITTKLIMRKDGLIVVSRSQLNIIQYNAYNSLISNPKPIFWNLFISIAYIAFL